ADRLLARLDLEDAEAAQFGPLPAPHRLLHGVEDRPHGHDRLDPRDVGVLVTEHELPLYRPRPVLSAPTPGAAGGWAARLANTTPVCDIKRFDCRRILHELKSALL